MSFKIWVYKTDSRLTASFPGQPG